MNITHIPEKSTFEYIENDFRAYLTYIQTDHSLDVRHTFVHPELRGKGLASKLVKEAYDFAVLNKLKPIASCSYAVDWLVRNPQYNGVASEDYAGPGTCAL